MNKIPLTRGHFALVDEEVYEELSKYKWYSSKSCEKYYAVRCVQKNKKKKYIYMHRSISNAAREQYVDHINGNSLDNRKSNLRICTNQENAFNSPGHRVRKSKFKGVFEYLGKLGTKYRSAISINRNLKYLGSFDTEIEAAKAYNEAAKELFGEYAFINKIPA